MADQKVMDALQELLQKGVDASQAETRRTMLDEVREKDPDDWDEREWDFANERGLIPVDRQGDYEMMLLEKRQAVERAQLQAWQGGNLPDTGTATLGVASGGVPRAPERPISADLGTHVEEVDSHEEPPSEDDRPYEERSYNDLKREARRRGLDTSGNQQELAERLRADDQVSS